MDEFHHGRKSKKLEDVARYWARGDQLDGGDIEDDLTAFGLMPSELEAWTGAAEAPEACLVWQENLLALKLFLAMQTQWIVSIGMHGVYYQGINYIALRDVMDNLGIKKKHRPRLFQDLQTMEYAALPVRNGDRRGGVKRQEEGDAC